MLGPPAAVFGIQMSPAIKNIAYAVAAICASAAVIGGTAARDSADLHFRTAGLLGGRTVLASNSRELTEISEGDFFEQLSELLKHNYVDPTAVDDTKLADGAIRGMVASLQN